MLEQPILSVSELNHKARIILETEFTHVWVSGEISNLSRPVSGHLYFSLKDEKAQIKCAFFRNRHNIHTKSIKDGLKVNLKGKLSLYEARGDYQLIVDNIEDAGLGELYRQFEELKQKLAKIGLFAAEHKKEIPKYPETIGVITSKTGAAIADILDTLKRRYKPAKVIIYPCEVQGKTATKKIINALTYANRQKKCDVIILGRGGGSIEDLWCFNNEELAHVIFASKIPIVTGIGHETDFTIADFVADYRAATPTAAAMRVTPNSEELLITLKAYEHRLFKAINLQLRIYTHNLRSLRLKLISPEIVIQKHIQTIDLLCIKITNLINNKQRQAKYKLESLANKLANLNPKVKIERNLDKIHKITISMVRIMQHNFYVLKQNHKNLMTALHAVSPLATLDRGYAIVSHNKQILHKSGSVARGDKLNIRLAQGEIVAEVIENINKS